MKTFIVLAAFVAAASCLNIPTEQELAGHWETFKATHGKAYPSKVEETFRMKIFKDNAIMIAKHNDLYDRGEVTFTVKLNQFSDLHTHEVAEKYNGFRMDLVKRGDRVHNESASSLNWSDNEKVDWRAKGFVTPVKDQGQCGSCWSFSATGALEGALFKKTGKLVSLSEQNLIDCSRKYGNAGCDGGLMDAAFKYIKANGGIDTEESYPYEEKDAKCRYLKQNQAGTVTGFVDVRTTEAALKDAVAKVGPVSVAIDASNWSFQNYASGVYYEGRCSSYSLDHGVLAVGYGSDGRNKDYWIVKNSWGPNWGENGYIRMARNRKNNCGIATMASYPTV